MLIEREIIEGGNLRGGADTICWIAEWYLECVGGGAVVVLNSVGSTVTKHFTAAETTRWKRTRSPRLPQSPPCHPFLSHPGGYVRHHPAPPTPPLNTVHMFALLMMMARLGGERGGVTDETIHCACLVILPFLLLAPAAAQFTFSYEMKRKTSPQGNSSSSFI